MRCHTLGAFLACFLCSLFNLQAQSTKAELFGVIRDPNGLAVNGAAVDLINTGADAKLSIESDTNGAYHFFALTAGTYQIAVTKNGFATLRRDGVVVRVGDQVSLDLELQIGT